MQDNAPIITTRQLFFVLFLSRLFSLISYTPEGETSADFTMTVLALIANTVLTAVVIIPFFILIGKNRHGTIIDFAIDRSKPLGYILAGLLCVFFVVIAADTVSNFEFFVSSTVMPNASVFLICLTMGLGVIYAAHLGLEAIARMSTLVLIITALSFVVIIFAIIEHFNPVYLRAQLSGTLPQFIDMVWVNFSQNLELVALLMLSQNTEGSIKKRFTTWNIGINITMILTTLAVFITFGDRFILTKPFPIQTFFSVAQVSIFQRLDVLHLISWVIITFVRGAIFLFVARQALLYILPKKIQQYALSICAAVMVIVSFALSRRITVLIWLYEVISSAIPIALFAVLIPLALLVIYKVKRGE